MSAERHKLAKELFADALEKADATERAAWLAQACGDDVQLRQSVEALLRAYEEAGAFLQEPAAGGRWNAECGMQHGEGGGRDADSPSPGGTIDLATPLTEKPGDKIGPYKLLQQIGEGGCGVVYMAEQAEPIRRKVALKVIKLGMDTRQVVARFEAERQALALMDHPNIAKVLDGGATETGRPYFVMDLVRGMKITEYCDENSFSTEQRLDLFMQVCHAIQHAHQKGIIHRDIKPSNILVTVVDGRPVPKVIDFGIAKATGGQTLTDKTLFTAFEQFIGTPAYMSPEQAALSGVDVDTRSDIYSLGVLLYELLTGQTPFDPKTLLAAGLDEMRRIIRETEPPKPSTKLATALAANPQSALRAPQLKEVRGDLDWIVMKCLEKDRARRYETATGLASDIHRHLTHEPVNAAAPSTLYRAQKFVRRYKTGLAIAGALVLLLAAGVVVSTWQAVRATRAESQERIQRAVAEQSRAIAEDRARQIGLQLYASELHEGLNAWQSGDLAGALAVLDRYQPRAGQEDLRGFEWFYLWRLCHSEQLTLFGHSNLVRAVAFSPDGRWLLSGGDDGKARLWDAATGREAAVLEGHTNGVTAVAFSPDGKMMATGGRDQRVRLWNTGLRQKVAALGGFTNHVGAVAFSPDGRWLAASSARIANRIGTPMTRFIDPEAFPAQIRLWDATAHKEVATLFGHQTGVQAMAFSPDGKTLASASIDGELRFWNVPAGSQQTNALKFGVPLVVLAFSPDGARLAVGGGDPYRRQTLLGLLDATTGREVAALKGHRGAVFALAFSPDGETLASAGLDQTVKFWDTAIGTELHDIKGHTAPIWSLAYDPAGRCLATASWDAAIKIWAAQHSQQFRTVPGFPGYSVRFSPDGKFLAAGGFSVGLLKIGSDERAYSVPDYRNGDVLVAWSPDGKLLAAAGSDQVVTLWETATWRKVGVLEGHQTKIWSLAFSPDGKTLASGGELRNLTLRLWDVAARRCRAVLRVHSSTVSCLTFTPDGRSLLAGSWNEIVSVDPETGREQWRLKEPAARLAVSPDGLWLAATPKGGPGTLRLMNLATKEVKWSVHAHTDMIRGLAFSPDGKTLATASLDATAALWNAATGQEILRYDVPGVAWSVDFSPDGRYWAVGSGSAAHSEMSLFQAATAAEISAPPGSPPVAPHSELAPERIGVWRLRAQALANRGDAAAAQVVYDRAIQQYPTNAAAWYAKALWLEQNNRLQESALTLLKVLDLAGADTNTPGLSQMPVPTWRLVELMASRGEWRKAVVSAYSLVELEPEKPQGHHDLAVLLARLDGREGYRRHCARAVARFAATSDPVAAEQIAKASLILPASGADLLTLAKMVDAALAASTNHLAWTNLLFPKGLLEYRQGHFAAAIEWLDKVPQTGEQPYRDAGACLVLAMARHHLNQRDEARAALAKDVQIIQPKLPKFEWGPITPPAAWADWVIAQALLREANALIEGPAAPKP